MHYKRASKIRFLHKCMDLLITLGFLFSLMILGGLILAIALYLYLLSYLQKVFSALLFARSTTLTSSYLPPSFKSNIDFFS